MRVAGIMSGTSLDGIDVAIVDIGRKRGAISVSPVVFRSTPYPKLVREALLAVSNSTAHISTIARLNFLLGELYAAAFRETCRRARIRLDSIALCGMHGQTIFHEGGPVEYLGRRVASTLQIGEAAVVAERTGVRVISNFRERDIAAGGKGAPLVPLIDYLLFRHPRIARVALNIGGIANITVIPAGADREDVIAFDTGPGNMVIDALVARSTKGRLRFDRDGRTARSGSVNPRLLEAMMGDPYLDLAPPKTCGREEYGREFVDTLVATAIALPDLIATATEFTARSIAYGVGLGRALSRTRDKKAWTGPAELIVSGGGVHNRFLMQSLRARLPDFAISTSADLGVDPDAKEAIAFAILAYEHAQGRPGNLPSATGACRAAILGKSTPGQKSESRSQKPE
jgi:anhydro-N-acetylmuramic acid kinase